MLTPLAKTLASVEASCASVAASSERLGGEHPPGDGGLSAHRLQLGPGPVSSEDGLGQEGPIRSSARSSVVRSRSCDPTAMASPTPKRITAVA